MSKLIDKLPNLDESCFKFPQQALLAQQQVSTHPPRILMLYGSLRERPLNITVTYNFTIQPLQTTLGHFGPLRGNTYCDARPF